MPGQEHQEQHNHDSVVSQHLNTEGQVNYFTPITKRNKYTFLLSSALLISL